MDRFKWCLTHEPFALDLCRDLPNWIIKIKKRREVATDNGMEMFQILSQSLLTLNLIICRDNNRRRNENKISLLFYDSSACENNIVLLCGLERFTFTCSERMKFRRLYDKISFISGDQIKVPRYFRGFDSKVIDTKATASASEWIQPSPKLRLFFKGILFHLVRIQPFAKYVHENTCLKDIHGA